MKDHYPTTGEHFDQASKNRSQRQVMLDHFRRHPQRAFTRHQLEDSKVLGSASFQSYGRCLTNLEEQGYIRKHERVNGRHGVLVYSYKLHIESDGQMTLV